MKNLIFSQKIFSDRLQKNLYFSLAEALKADDDGEKSVLSAFCLGEMQYFDNGDKQVIEYAVSHKTVVKAASFRKAVANQYQQINRGIGVFADNLIFVGRNEDCVMVEDSSLMDACKLLLSEKNLYNRISIHRTKFCEKGFSIKVDEGIQLFMEPYYFWDFNEVKRNCSHEIVCVAQKYYDAGYNLFGTNSEDGDELICLLGDCNILDKEVFEAWAGYRAPLQRKEKFENFYFIPSTDGLLN